MKKVYAFDFDGTLTTRDTLLAFIRYAKGSLAFFGGFLLHAPLLVLMKLRLYPNWKTKQRLFAWFFKGMPVAEFDDLCDCFASDSLRLLRPKALEEVRKAQADNARVLIVSASIENWVRPFFRDVDVEVVGTQVEVVDGMLTGRFLTRNCYGSEKVRRILELCPNRTEYELIAYGDSRGDKEMLQYADKGYYKPFGR